MPLESVVRTRETVGWQTVNHAGQLPAVTISFGLRPGVASGQRRRSLSSAWRDKVLPPTVTTSFQGSAKVFQASLQNLTLLLVVAIGVVYIVLGVLYESYIHPLTILSGLPSAGVGALLTLIVFKGELNIYSFVGLIMLIGIVKKNAIMQIDFALEAERKHGKTPAEAIYEGCIIRFRPIMMTTMAALVWRASHGSGTRRGRGIAPSAGSHGGGRFAGVAGDDAVLDAGGLHVHGCSRSALEKRRRPRRINDSDRAARDGLTPRRFAERPDRAFCSRRRSSRCHFSDGRPRAFRSLPSTSSTGSSGCCRAVSSRLRSSPASRSAASSA